MPGRLGRGLAGVLAAAGLCGLAAGQTPLSTAPPATSIGGPRPPFFVPWKVDAPGLTARPALKRGRPPAYPPASLRAKEAGVTRLEVCIGVDGRLADIRLTASSGSARLDRAVLDWAQSVVYSPALFNGQPLAVCGYPLIYEWRLNQQ